MPKPKRQPITTSGIILQHFGKVALAASIVGATWATYDLVTPDNDNKGHFDNIRKCSGGACLTVQQR